MQDSCMRDSLSIGIIALIYCASLDNLWMRDLVMLVAFSWGNDGQIPGHFLCFTSDSVFYMTDNLVRRFIFETAASPRSLISCRSETVRAFEPQRSKDNISHTGRQYNRHATFRPAIRVYVYVVSCTYTTFMSSHCVFHMVYMSVTPVLLYI